MHFLMPSKFDNQRQIQYLILEELATKHIFLLLGYLRKVELTRSENTIIFFAQYSNNRN